VTKLPCSLSGKTIVKALTKAGFSVKRQKGSHIILRRDEPFAQVVVPDHKNIDTGTLANILDGANLTAAEFLTLLK
jgi:predicted RNA binding protein YcfA (HicA-like mRNA interferase family)